MNWGQPSLKGQMESMMGREGQSLRLPINIPSFPLLWLLGWEALWSSREA